GWFNTKNRYKVSEASTKMAIVTLFGGAQAGETMDKFVDLHEKKEAASGSYGWTRKQLFLKTVALTARDVGGTMFVVETITRVELIISNSRWGKGSGFFFGRKGREIENYQNGPDAVLASGWVFASMGVLTHEHSTHSNHHCRLLSCS
ncbi:MAG: hypothetical protein AAF191_17790, partial [Verrucomicrobiota bacterium]